MRFEGKVYKDGRFWLAEVPLFDAMTQGRSRKECLEMIADWFAVMANSEALSIEVHLVGKSEFEVSSPDTSTMVRLLLERQRQRSGLSLAEAAERLGARSRNAYARYEQGSSVPTVEKFDALLRAVSPWHDIIVRQSVGEWQVPPGMQAKGSMTSRATPALTPGRRVQRKRQTRKKHS